MRHQHVDCRTKVCEVLTLWTELQHWIGPVEHELAGGVPLDAGAVEVTVTVVVYAGVVVGLPPGMATARIARERTESEVRANILGVWLELLACWATRLVGRRSAAARCCC